MKNWKNSRHGKIEVRNKFAVVPKANFFLVFILYAGFSFRNVVW